MGERFTIKAHIDPRWPETPRFMVQGTMDDGRRVRRVYETRFRALQEAAKLNAEVNRTGVLGNLTDAQRIESERCILKLAAVGVTLTEAVDAYLSRRAELDKGSTVSEVYEHMLKAKEAQRVGRLYLAQLRNMLKDFATAHAQRKLDSFETPEITEILLSARQEDGSPVSAKTRNNLRGYLGTLWEHAVKNNMAKRNPVKGTVKAEEHGDDYTVLTPAAMREAIAAARAICEKSLAPLVIQAFAGLRSSEVGKLDWAEVNLEEGYITVSKGKSKTRTRRVVPIAANLSAFLAPLARSEGKVTSVCHRVEFPKIRAAVRAKGHRWDDNALRHSFASYRLSETNNENMTALEAGHTVQILHENYKGLVTKKAATEWWAIMPT